MLKIAVDFQQKIIFQTQQNIIFRVLNKILLKKAITLENYIQPKQIIRIKTEKIFKIYIKLT